MNITKITNTHVTVSQNDIKLIQLMDARINVWGCYNSDGVLSPELRWANSQPFQGWEVVATAEDFFLAQGYLAPSLREIDDFDGDEYELAIPRLTVAVANQGYHGYYEEISAGSQRYLYRRDERVAEAFWRSEGERGEELWFNERYVPTDEVLILDGGAERLYIRADDLDRIPKTRPCQCGSGQPDDLCQDPLGNGCCG